MSEPSSLPSKQEIRRFVDESGGTAGKREVARAFNIKGPDRIWLKRVMKEIEAERRTETAEKGRAPGRLPPVAVLLVSGVDDEGWLLCRPVTWAEDAEAPRIVLDENAVRGPAAKEGEQFLCRLERTRFGYTARPIRRLEVLGRRIMGVYQQTGREGRVQPTDKKLRQEMTVQPGDAGGAKSGDLVMVEALPGRPLGPRRCKVVEVLGSYDNPRAISLLAMQANDIPREFSAEALGEAAMAEPVTGLGRRTDLRHLPLVTIDPADARDHDDAVFAERDSDPANEGGFRLVVAIADVAHYVRPGTALDRDAQTRGVSVYFPDRVAPMLPEQLSADLCSLMPGVDRPVLAVEITIDRNGRKLRHSFTRALMRSAANIAYEAAQAAIDGDVAPELEHLLEPVLKPLFEAWQALDNARTRRGPLELDIAERKVEIGGDGYIAAIRPRERIDAHRVIEEFMVLANVCAAETLERRKVPCVYRIHEPPDLERLKALKDFLATLSLPLSLGEVIRPKHFNRALVKVRGTDAEPMVNEAVLRAQTQAYYGTDNLGHFGLALRRYAHFTSPIRRYADLLVHRGLIDAMSLGRDGLGGMEQGEIQKLAELTSTNERRAMTAERDAMDRFTAIFLQDRVGALFSARITGVTKFGLFVALDETGASGIVPIRSLASDYFDFDERQKTLTGRRTGETFRLGESLTVRLKEASPVTGGLGFEIVEPENSRRSAARGKFRSRGKSLPARPKPRT
ncbi:MAG: ribonuclease R [Pseudomonadota bacterium]|nr:ribonuclease R [Pseudomonadota bacterium]